MKRRIALWRFIKIFYLFAPREALMYMEKTNRAVTSSWMMVFDDKVSSFEFTVNTVTNRFAAITRKPVTGSFENDNLKQLTEV
jgi:hypothetical protein